MISETWLRHTSMPKCFEGSYLVRMEYCSVYAMLGLAWEHSKLIKRKLFLIESTICRQEASASGSVSWAKYCFPVLQPSLFFNKFTPLTLWVQRCAGGCRARKYGDPRCHMLALNKVIITAWLCWNEVWKVVLGFLSECFCTVLCFPDKEAEESPAYSFFCLVSRKIKLTLLEKQ